GPIERPSFDVTQRSRRCARKCNAPGAAIAPRREEKSIQTLFAAKQAADDPAGYVLVTYQAKHGLAPAALCGQGVLSATRPGQAASPRFPGAIVALLFGER